MKTKHDGMQTTFHKRGHRKPYSPPRLVEYGTIRQLTLGAVLSGVDALAGKSV